MFQNVRSDELLRPIRRDHRDVDDVSDDVGLVEGLQVDIYIVWPHVEAATHVELPRFKYVQVDSIVSLGLDQVHSFPRQFQTTVLHKPSDPVLRTQASPKLSRGE